VEQDTTVNSFSPVCVRFKTQVIDEQVTVDCPGKGKQGWDHLDGRADRIDNLRTCVQALFRRKNIINPEDEACRDLPVPDIGAADMNTGIMQELCCSRVPANPDFNGTGIMLCDVFPDTGLNMFIGTHSNRI